MPGKMIREWTFDYVIEKARESGMVGVNRGSLREISVSEYVKQNTSKNGVVDIKTIFEPLLKVKASENLKKMEEKLKALRTEAKEIGVI